MAITPKRVKVNPTDELAQDIHSVYAKGYVILDQVFQPEDIHHIATCFHQLYMEKYKHGLVSNRNYKRFSCKIPVSHDYAAILANDTIHQMMSELLGDDYVLSTFSSHSSMPGSSEQLIHTDGDSPLSSGDYRFNQTTPMYVHIPLKDMQPEDGATILWPACCTGGNDDKWIWNNVPPSEQPLRCGDAVIKSSNCWHAGAANHSDAVRHIITLVFVNKYHDNTQNNGLIPGRDYGGRSCPALPYRIASHHATEPNDMEYDYQDQSWGKCKASAKLLAETIKLEQTFFHSQLLPKALIDIIRDDSESLIRDPSLTFNVIDFFLPLVKPLFSKGQVAFHSISIEASPKSLGCDDPVFKKDAENQVVYTKERMIRVLMPLATASEWMVCYQGSKSMTMSALNNKDVIKLDGRGIPAIVGDAVFVSGGLLHEIAHDVPCLVVTFVAADFVLSYDDRHVISDCFYSHLPARLQLCVRYSSIYIKEAKNKDFKLNRLGYLYYIIMNKARLMQCSGSRWVWCFVLLSHALTSFFVCMHWLKVKLGMKPHNIFD